MNIIETKSIGQVILNEKTPNRDTRREHYLIPYYQRGYRWDVEHVKALLDDIHNFIQSKEENYCLQPIVVVSNIDDTGLNIWEVIDGQQRLITMYIICQYLNKPRYTIIFGQRIKSTAFLKNLNESNYNHDNPDFHFMSQAFEIVKQWFEEKTKNDVGYIDDFYSSMTKKVQVIWYQVEELAALYDKKTEDEIEEAKIDIFNRLNVGKIPLTDAELIRALLLSKIKNGLSEREAIMRQSEISNEWHQIETDLRSDELWYFINNKPKENTTSAIEQIFSLIAVDNDKKYSTYLWFEKQIRSGNEDQERKNAVQLWETTKNYYQKFKYWYNNSKLYHFIGYLLTQTDRNESLLRDIVENSNCSKSSFEKWVIKEVKKTLNKIDIDDINYERNPADIKKILLLHNLITVNELSKSQNQRFPFHLYKDISNNGGWSIEHIHAQRSSPMKDETAIRTWLKETYSALHTISIVQREQTKIDDKSKVTTEIKDYNLKEQYLPRILEFMESKKINTDEFNVLKDELIMIFESGSVHELDNLALLSKNDNSSLNNAIFPVKRKRIIQLEKEGKFVPLCTRNLFLKFYSDSNQQPYYWSKLDKENYFNNIKSTVAPYLIK